MAFKQKIGKGADVELIHFNSTQVGWTKRWFLALEEAMSPHRLSWWLPRVTTTWPPPFSLQILLVFEYSTWWCISMSDQWSIMMKKMNCFQTIQNNKISIETDGTQKLRTGNYHLHIHGRIVVGFRLPGAEFSCFPRTSLETSSRWLKTWFLQMLHSWCFVHVWTLFIFVCGFCKVFFFFR